MPLCSEVHHMVAWQFLAAMRLTTQDLAVKSMSVFCFFLYIFLSNANLLMWHLSFINLKENWFTSLDRGGKSGTRNN